MACERAREREGEQGGWWGGERARARTDERTRTCKHAPKGIPHTSMCLAGSRPGCLCTVRCGERQGSSLRPRERRTLARRVRVRFLARTLPPLAEHKRSRAGRCSPAGRECILGEKLGEREGESAPAGREFAAAHCVQQRSHGGGATPDRGRGRCQHDESCGSFRPCFVVLPPVLRFPLSLTPVPRLVLLFCVDSSGPSPPPPLSHPPSVRSSLTPSLPSPSRTQARRHTLTHYSHTHSLCMYICL
jgi:hypothetical protein